MGNRKHSARFAADKRSGFKVRCGLTLVEVVVGLALAGTLLAMALLATGQHLRQLKLAKERRTATVYLDQFLSQWSLNQFEQRDFERSQVAVRSMSPELEIEISQVRRTAIPQSEVVRVSVVSKDNRQSRAWAEIVRAAETGRARP